MAACHDRRTWAKPAPLIGPVRQVLAAAVQARGLAAGRHTAEHWVRDKAFQPRHAAEGLDRRHGNSE